MIIIIQRDFWTMFYEIFCIFHYEQTKQKIKLK